MVPATRVSSQSYFPYFKHPFCNGFGGHYLYFIYLMFALIFFSSFFHIQELKERSWFLNVKGLKYTYTGILQQ
jgi:hypothetical protein